MIASAEQILDALNQSRDQFVTCLKELTMAESPSLERLSIRQAQAILGRALMHTGFHVHHIPGERTGGHIYARPKRRTRGNAFQLIIGHCDTVWPLGTTRVMPVELKDGRLNGPGVFDMKGGLVQIVFALRALSQLGLEPELTPVVLITSDEEVGSPESRRHIERLARRAGRAYIVEPGLGLSGKLKTARKGTGHFEVTVKGKASHAGIAPEEGASAILELSHVIQKLFNLNDASQGVTVNVGTVSGGLRSNIVAPESRAAIDVRITKREDAERLERIIRDITPTTRGVSLEITGEINRWPMEPTPRNQALWRVAKRCGETIGLALEQGTSGGASDGNFTSQYTATLDGLGPVGDGAHASHEFIDVDQTIERCALLALLLMAPQV